MARYVAPLVKRKTYTEALGSAVPVFLQTQARQQQMEALRERQRVQQEQFNLSLLQKEQDRLDAAERANAKMAYDQQKDQQKLERDRRSDLYGFDTSKMTPSQVKAVNALREELSASLDSDDDSWTKSLQGVTELIDLFNNTEDVYDKREAEFADYALAGKEFSDPTKQFVGDQSVVNEYNTIRDKGGFDADTIQIQDGQVVAYWLGPNGDYMVDEKTGNFMIGPISQAPYYQPQNYTALYNLDANLQDRADVSAADFLLGLEDKIEVINGNASLSTEDKRSKLAEMMRNGFADPGALSENFKLAYSSAIRAYKMQNTLNDNAQLNEAQVSEALENYIDEAVNLYQPKQSLIEQEIDFASYAEQRASKVINQINRRTDLSREEKAQEASKRIRNIFETGTEDADKRARATAKNIWLDNNEGAEYSESEAYDNYLSNMYDYVDAFFLEEKEESSPAGRQPTQSEISKANARQSVMSSANFSQTDFSGIDPQVIQFSGVVMPEEGMDDATSFQLPTFKGKINMADYLPDALTRESKVVYNYNTGEQEVKLGDYKNMNTTPTQFSVFIDENNNKIVQLSGFSDKNIPPVFINITQNTPAKSKLNQLLEDTYGAGISIDDMFKTHAQNLMQ